MAESGQVAAVPSVEIATAIAAARADATASRESDPVYSELMATYVELGELLERNNHVTPESPPDVVSEYEEECRVLVGRLIELEAPLRHQFDQRWARWCANNMDLERK
ncbi:hypothetical protein [Amycolatopsis sp. NPDC051071]|uniref:hypothetical protein n=1 Tax=Amycolatopsis sp. NPDC051071 TaxID=3154637 RepID=UPI003444E766